MKLEELKRSMEMGEQAIAESVNWTDNQQGGWEILAMGYKRIAEELIKMVEAQQTGGNA